MEPRFIADAAERILADFADPQTLNAAHDRSWYATLWQALEDNGLTRAWVDESFGGAGLSVAEGFELARVAGRFALPVPLVETLLASWLLAQAGIVVPGGPISPAPTQPDDRISINHDGRLVGKARAVPFAGEVAHFAVMVEHPKRQIALVRAVDCHLVAAVSLSGDSRSHVDFCGVKPLAIAQAPASMSADALLLMGCAARALQIAAALQLALSYALDYANQRVAFGRTIGKFQAVQNNLARLAGEVAAATAAADSAADALAAGHFADEGVKFEAVSAKIRAAEAAAAGTAIAHQVFGAIGLTEEHVLHRFTLRAIEWRDDFGNESHWAVWLGKRIAAARGAALWPLIASR